MHHSTLFLIDGGGWQVWQASCFIQILFRAPSRLIITSVNHHHNRHNCPHFLIAIKMMIIAATMIIIINVVDIFRYLDFIQSSPRILQPPSAQCSLFFCLKHHHHRCHLCNYHDTGNQSLSQLYLLGVTSRTLIEIQFIVIWIRSTLSEIANRWWIGWWVT